MALMYVKGESFNLSLGASGAYGSLYILGIKEDGTCTYSASVRNKSITSVGEYVFIIVCGSQNSTGDAGQAEIVFTYTPA